jgi:hypothetical protein
MSLITAEELARGLIIGTFGGAAGLCTIVFPGSAIWLVPAAAAVGGCALTVPEIRSEVERVLPALPAPAQLRALPDLIRHPVTAMRALGGPAPASPQDAPAPAPRRARRSTAPTTAASPLPAREWLKAVNDRPDDNPHLTVVGPSGCGKTTFVSAALDQRPGRVVVLTPKVTPGAWRGAEVVTLSDDLSYAPLATALNDLQTEAKQRSVALRRGERLEPLTVVLDELPELAAEIPGAGKFAVRLSRWGRELGMRQVVLATSDDALNIPGWAATRSNYVRVELGKSTPEGTRPGYLDDGQGRQPLDLATVKDDAGQAQLRPWRSSQGTTIPLALPPHDLLADLLAEPVTSASQCAGNASGVTVTVTNQGGNGNGNTPLVTPAAGVTIYATATAAGPFPPPSNRRRTRRGGGLDMRRRHQLAKSDHVHSELAIAYAAARARGVKSFRAAYAELGGNRKIALAAWNVGRQP